MDLKAETLGLAVIIELPMVIVDVQRGGPSTGMPTKTEQADLLLAMFGRHGESPMPIVAAASPSDCFEMALEAARIAVTYRTPVILLSDTFLTNSSEPWQLPELDSLPVIEPQLRDRERRRAVHAVRARREARAPVGGPRHAGARPPDRRPRTRGGDREHQLRPREPRADDLPAPRQGRGDRQGHPAHRGRRSRRRRRTADPRLGVVARHDPSGLSSRPGPGPQGRHRAPAAPQPVPVEHRRGRDGATPRC